MKKGLLIVISILLLIVITVVVILSFDKEKEIKKEPNESALKFKAEYEALNGLVVNDKTYSDMTIDGDNIFVYADMEKLKEIIKGTGVIYFGFPECPWCRLAIPVMEEAAKEVGIDKIYYYNVLKIRDTKELDEDGNVVITNPGTEDYQTLLELLDEALPEYNGLNDPMIKRIYVPLVITFKDGKVIDSHLGTVDSQ
ncbi:MAG: hypothetical protein PHO63_04210, partial [Bacilli bacterium]|nr:hypothetical protein [Bacilli bacterium]